MKNLSSLALRLLICLVFAGSLSAATVDGITIHSSIEGEGSRTVILVHGWTCNETTWKSQVPELAKSYQVITLDLPGHGKSGSPKDGKLSMELFARAIEAVRDEAKAERVVLAGHSMGTPVVIQYARMYPQHVIALVFVDGLVGMPTTAAGNMPSADQFKRPEGLKIRENIIRGMFSTATTPEMQEHILSMMLGAPGETAAGAMEAILDPSIYTDDVFPQSILGLYADDSRIIDPESLKNRFPKLEYSEIPGTGHFLMLEKPGEFNKLFLSFLDKLNY